jgi:hypothetical protein
VSAAAQVWLVRAAQARLARAMVAGIALPGGAGRLRRGWPRRGWACQSAWPPSQPAPGLQELRLPEQERLELTRPVRT